MIALYRRLRNATGHTNLVEKRGRQTVERALAQHLKVGGMLLKFSGLPPEERRAALEEMSRATNKAMEVLRLEVGMFLDAEGKPIEGAV